MTVCSICWSTGQGIVSTKTVRKVSTLYSLSLSPSLAGLTNEPLESTSSAKAPLEPPTVTHAKAYG